MHANSISSFSIVDDNGEDKTEQSLVNDFCCCDDDNNKRSWAIGNFANEKHVIKYCCGLSTTLGTLLPIEHDSFVFCFRTEEITVHARSRYYCIIIM